jgi:2-(1,2-epoxy-1,2-dihydrophenyl)acetyl-CoA isomerase
MSKETSMGKTVLWEKENGIGIISLNRPEKMNALTREVLHELSAVLETVEKDASIKVVILTGRGKGFCAGGDLEGHPAFSDNDPLKREGYLREAQRCTLQLTRLPKPVIAAINGVAAGAGLDLALACDIRIAAEDAVLAEVFVRAGGMPDMGGTYFLPRLLGTGKALELILTGDRVDAREACRIGLVNKIVPSSEVMVQAKALGTRLAGGSSDAYRLIKWSVYRGLGQSMEDALENEIHGQSLLLGTAFMQEYARNFSKKKT